MQFAIDIDHIGEAPVPQPLKMMIVNGYNIGGFLSGFDTAVISGRVPATL